jgi:hypothetical protein
MKKLYIFGVQRSGTSLLAGLLGGHPSINMLTQSTSGDQSRLTGKIYQGNKLCVNHDVRWAQKSSRIRNFLYYKTNWIFKRLKKYHALRPSARFTVQDLLKEECKVVIITRDFTENVNSILRHTSMSKKMAVRELTEGGNIIQKIMDRNNHIVVSLLALTSDTENTLKKICEYLDIKFSPEMLNGIQHQPQDIYNKKYILAKK